MAKARIAAADPSLYLPLHSPERDPGKSAKPHKIAPFSGESRAGIYLIQGSLDPHKYASPSGICIGSTAAELTEMDMGWVHPWVGLGRILQHM